MPYLPWHILFLITYNQVSGSCRDLFLNIHVETVEPSKPVDHRDKHFLITVF